MTVAAALRARAVAVPAWVWLAGIVALSIVIRVALARRIVAPWIMVDELVYSELAKSFAAGREFLLREVTSTGYGFVYPVLISPAWLLYDAVPDSYAAAKAINAVVMSLTAIPAYLLARRLVSPPLALVAAALSVLVPSMLYTGTLMTENAFYPLFVLAAWLLVVTLERPTPLRQLALLGVCGLAYATRAQALALLAAAATAPVVHAFVERRGLRRGLRAFATLYGLLAAGAAAALLAAAARGDSPLDVLGAYRAALESDYEPRRVLGFVLYHAGELSLYLGVLPLAALLTLWLAPRAAPPPARAFSAASFSLVVWLLPMVATFASQRHVDKIEERNLFYVAPLALTALVATASNGVIPRRRRPVVAAAAIAGVLPVFVPYERFITTSAVADTFALLPWWWVQDQLISLEDVRWAALAVCLAAAALFVLLPRRHALVLPALVAAYFVATAFVVENGRHGLHVTSVGKLWAGIRVEHPDWIDRTVGGDAQVAFLWTGRASAETLWENEFFNRSVGPVYDLAPTPDPLASTPVERGDDGRLRSPDGEVVRAEYVLADGSVEVAGTPVARDERIGVQVLRVGGPVVLLTRIRGLYPNDTWSGRTVGYERVDCTGGRLSVLLQSDPSLFRRDQVVVARARGDTVGRAVVPPAGETRLTVPLRPDPDGRCRVHFEVASTAVPARIVPGSTDDRELGVHFSSFGFRP